MTVHASFINVSSMFMKYACILMKNIQKKTIHVQNLCFIKVKILNIGNIFFQIKIIK